MARAPSLFDKIIARGADALAERLQVPLQNRQAFRDTFVHVVSNTFASMHGGELLYTPQEPRLSRQERRDRIQQAIERGEADADIARREGVSRRWVRRLRAARGTAAY